jgi:hypothetical protein
MLFKGKARNNILKSLEKISEISRKRTISIRSLFYGPQTQKDLPSSKSICMVATSQSWNQLKKMKVKSHLQPYLLLLPWSKDALLSMDHHKTPSYQE